MHIATAILSVTLLGAMFLGYVNVAERFEEKERHAASGHFLSTVQNSVYEWHSKMRQNTDSTGWNWPGTAHERNRLVEYMPKETLTGDMPTLTASGQNLLFKGVAHGSGDAFTLSWRNATTKEKPRRVGRNFRTAFRVLKLLTLFDPAGV